MVYCMSDIHGEYDRFKKMMELIQFSDQDELYIIGDVIDRFSQGVDILYEIMEKPNIHMILGNHEMMLLETLGENNKVGARELWKQNGGYATYIDLIHHRLPEERRKIIEYIEGLPDFIEFELEGEKYYLVHGMPSDNKDTRLWGRPDRNMKAPMENAIVIIGHTPTIFLNDESDEDEEPFRIWYGDRIICIDCGCGNEIAERRLACLRLNDMKEYYV